MTVVGVHTDAPWVGVAKDEAGRILGQVPDFTIAIARQHHYNTHHQACPRNGQSQTPHHSMIRRRNPPQKRALRPESSPRTGLPRSVTSLAQLTLQLSLPPTYSPCAPQRLLHLFPECLLPQAHHHMPSSDPSPPRLPTQLSASTASSPYATSPRPRSSSPTSGMFTLRQTPTQTHRTT